jgi:hypothetical protein
MARRKSKKSKRRTKYKSAFNIRAAVIAYASLSLSTRALLKVTPWQFLTDGYLTSSTSSSISHGQGVITLKEMIGGGHMGPSFASDAAMTYTGQSLISGAPTLGSTLQANMMENGVGLVLGQIGLVAADKIAQNLGVYKSFNKTVRMVGMGNMVKA